MTSKLSRREMLKRTMIAGAAVTVPLRVTARAAQPSSARRFETLTAAEAETLEAIVARLIPTDENGPGAKEAGAVRYIDRALTGALASSRDAYAAGLTAVDTYARTVKRRPFARLPAGEQDDVLRDLEQNVATGFSPSSVAFFNLVLTHTIQGTFCDPYYGGNADFIGWELLGYPGVRLAVGASQQRMDVAPAPRQISAYDFPMFGSAPSEEGGGRDR